MKKRCVTLALSLCLCVLTLPASQQPSSATRSVYFAAGQAAAPIRIEVFSDYQCPACRVFYTDTLKRILSEAEQESRVSVVYHDFPLQMHRFAREATRYALAARRLGKSQWSAVTDALYINQDQWSVDGQIDRIAAKALSSVDFDRIRELVQDPAIEQEIAQELELGRRLQVNATPTFFILAGGRAQRVVGGVPYQVLESHLSSLSK